MSQLKYDEIAQKIIHDLGGEENIEHLLHCATRLRFNLKNKALADLEKIKKISGVLGVMDAGAQIQVIIGSAVVEVYEEVIAQLQNKQSNLGKDQDVKQEKKKWTIKSIFVNILDAFSGCIGPIIPVITVCAFFKAISSILGPDMLNVLPIESDIYTLFSFVGDAGFYFFPIILGYSAAKKFNVLPVLGILLGCIMMHPSFISIATEGNSFSIFGIPCLAQNYANTVFPIILSVWFMHYIEQFWNQYLPKSIKGVFAPAFTILIMLPFTFCLFGPIGTYLGNYIVASLLSLQDYIGFLGMAIIAAVYPLLVMTGMHMILITTLLQVFATQGFDGFAGPALTFASFSVMGVCIGSALRIKNKEQRNIATEYAVTAIVAGTSEPCLYGICMRYKYPFIGLLAGGFAGGLYGGITGVLSTTLVPSTNFLSALAFMGGTDTNMINGFIGCGIALVVAAACTYFLGFKNNLETM